MSAVLRWKRDPAWTLVMLGGFAILGLFLVWPLVTTFATTPVLNLIMGDRGFADDPDPAPVRAHRA